MPRRAAVRCRDLLNVWWRASQGWHGLCICYTAAARKILRSRLRSRKRSSQRIDPNSVVGGWPLLTANLQRVRAQLSPRSVYKFGLTATRSLVLGSPLTRAFRGRQRPPTPFCNLGLRRLSLGRHFCVWSLARSRFSGEKDTPRLAASVKLEQGSILRRSAEQLAIGVT
jgi:hypothetical protein